MKHYCYLTVVLLSCLSFCAPDGAKSQSGDVDRRKQVEADWLNQDEVRHLSGNPVTTQEDAAGAVDGVKKGKWGFHTGQDERPWWQVDLGKVHALSRVLVFNRCDGGEGIAARAANLRLLLSDDGKAWREAYRHDGKVFFGATDGKPLTIALNGAPARFVRIQLPERGFLHFDEVEVYGEDAKKNLALGQPANQSSVSPWSTRHMPSAGPTYPVEEVLKRGRQLMNDLRGMGVDVKRFERTFNGIEARMQELARAGLRPLPNQMGDDTSRLNPVWKRAAAPPEVRDLYFRARRAVRQLALSNPLLDFDKVLFVKRVPGSYSHMSDQNYGWWSRPGGGIYVLEGFKSDAPRLKCLTEQFPTGSFMSPDLSYDGKKILFAYCKYYPHVAGERNKVDKDRLPEDAFYHIFEMNLDGSGLRQLTKGRYDDFDARYLPNGDIVFLSTRRGQFVQCTKDTAMQTTKVTMPDSYVRCGGDHYRPVAVYTLHVMDKDGGNLRALSPFENFEWTPSVANDGRVIYARWDYVDRDNMPYMKLWATNPDGTNPQIVYGNFTRNPHCVFEARSIPGSHKMVFTASAHHSITGGSLAILDPLRAMDGLEAIQRLTPEVCFPEVEGWPQTYYVNPFPLSEKYFLTAWSNQPLRSEGSGNSANSVGIYLYDAFGNLELIYRDPRISCMYPIPLKPRCKPPAISSAVAWDGEQEGRMLLLNVYEGLKGVQRGAVKKLRIVAVPPKVQPEMNQPNLGVTRDDPGKCVLGTVPVEADGSAYFRVPSGVGVFFQALDKDGVAIQTMRSLTYVQPGQTLTCVGCHEARHTAPRRVGALAARRAPSKITVGPEGSWPLRYDRLVQPVLDQHCVRCHRSDSSNKEAAQLDLTNADKSYQALLTYGKPSLQEHVWTRYREGRSVAGEGAAQTSALLALLRKGHYGVKLDDDSFTRLVTWMDTYAQRLGSFSAEQEERLREFRRKVAGLLEGNE